MEKKRINQNGSIKRYAEDDILIIGSDDIGSGVIVEQFDDVSPNRFISRQEVPKLLKTPHIPP